MCEREVLNSHGESEQFFTSSVHIQFFPVVKGYVRAPSMPQNEPSSFGV